MTPPAVTNIDKTAAKAGFTLIETMAVMMIVALVSAIVVTYIPGTGRAGLKAIVMDSVALLRRERQGAILTGTDRRVALDGENRVLIGDSGDRVAVPRDVSIDILGADANWGGQVAVAAFHPDGGSSGGALRFTRDGVTYEVRVNWYSGGVTVETL